MSEGVRPDLCTARAENGELRIDFAVHGRHSWLTFRDGDLDGLKTAVDAAIAQREAAKR